MDLGRVSRALLRQVRALTERLRAEVWNSGSGAEAWWETSGDETTGRSAERLPGLSEQLI